MNSKKFSCILFLSFILAFIALVTLNMLVENVFSHRNKKEGIINLNMVYNEKPKYIAKHTENFTGLILGGSKAAGLRTDKLNEYTGFTFYNYWTNIGSFEDYNNYFDFLIKEFDVKEVVIHLSGHEIERLKSYHKYLPLQYRGGNRFSNFRKIMENHIKQLKEYCNLKTLYNSYKNRNIILATNKDGSRNFSTSKTKHSENPEEYINEYVLRDSLASFETYCQYVFTRDVTEQMIAAEKNIQILNDIYNVCKKKKIKLTLVLEPTFFCELSRYISQKYIDYLHELVNIQPVWNFGGINAVNMNPHNFMDIGHYYDFVGDKMIDIMYSDVPNTTDLNAFGILLTPDNIDAYITSQRNKWQELKEEFKLTGTVQLNGITDNSYLGK